jgi:hypothetical protein
MKPCLKSTKKLRMHIAARAKKHRLFKKNIEYFIWMGAFFSASSNSYSVTTGLAFREFGRRIKVTIPTTASMQEKAI